MGGGQAFRTPLALVSGSGLGCRSWFLGLSLAESFGIYFGSFSPERGDGSGYEVRIGLGRHLAKGQRKPEDLSLETPRTDFSKAAGTQLPAVPWKAPSSPHWKLEPGLPGASLRRGFGFGLLGIELMLRLSESTRRACFLIKELLPS